jgi:NodT family efflux transporter outer membrane factor (OMF) lipoprotein
MVVARRLFVPLLAGALLAGCVGGHPRAPDLRLPTAFEAPASGPALTPAQLDRWWLIFDDPVLTALEDEALRTAPDAMTAFSRLVEAGAVRGAAVAGTFPTGSISGNASKEHEINIGGGANSLFPIGGDYISQTAALNVSWELDVFGRLAQQRKIAKANFVATQFDVEGALASLAANVADDYFQATGLAIQIEDAQETVRIDTELARVAQLKADRGLGARSDADRVAGDLAQARAQLTDLQSQLHAARRNLLILVGRRMASTESIVLRDHADEAPAVPAAVPGDLLQRRPDVRESEAQLRSEAGTDRLKHLAIFPTFTLLPALGLSRTTQPSVGYIPPATLIPEQLTTSLGYWTLAGGVSQPVLNIPQLLFDAKAEDARSEQAVIAYEKTVQTAYGEAENALVDLDAGRRAVQLLVDGEARAHRAYDAANRRYAMGLDDLTTALTTEQAWRSTRAALTSEQVQALERAVTTYKALGGGWTADPAARPIQTSQAQAAKAP